MLDFSDELLNLTFVIMIKYVQKYRFVVGRITLFSYLLIFTLNIFHFHNYHYNDTAAIDVGNESNFQSKLLVSEFDCVVHQNFSSLHSLAFPHSIPVFLCNDKKSAHLPEKADSHFYDIVFSNNHLRAPPFSFS